jgi:hypothetical protein
MLRPFCHGQSRAGDPFAIRSGRERRRRSSERAAIRKAAKVTQRNVELVIGRLVTDEAFRARFIRDPAATLIEFVEHGYELTPVEAAALEAIDPRVWTRTAQHIDPRLQKVALMQGVAPASPEEEP